MNLQLDLTPNCIMITLQSEQFLLIILTTQASIDTTEVNTLEKLKNDLNYEGIKKVVS
jgi:hypothetical protein